MTPEDNPGTTAVELVGRDLGAARDLALRMLAESARPSVRASAFRALALVEREHGAARHARLLLRRSWYEARRGAAWDEAGLAQGSVDGLVAIAHPRASNRRVDGAASAQGLLREGVWWSQRGDFDMARRAFSASLRRTADPQVRVAVLLSRGETLLAAGAAGDAAEQLHHALVLAQAGGLHYLAALTRQNLGCLAGHTGDHDAALTYLDAAAPFVRGARAAVLALDRAEVLADAGLGAESRAVVAREAHSPHADRIAALWFQAQTALRRGDTTAALHQSRLLRGLSSPGRLVSDQVTRRARSAAERPRLIPLTAWPPSSPVPPPVGVGNPRALLTVYRRTWVLGHGSDGDRPALPALRATLTRLGRQLHDWYPAGGDAPAAAEPLSHQPPGQCTVRYRLIGRVVRVDVADATKVWTESVGSPERVRAIVSALRTAAWRFATTSTPAAARELAALTEGVLPRSVAPRRDGPVSVVPHGDLWQVPWGLLPGLDGREVRVVPSSSRAVAPLGPGAAPTRVVLVAGPTESSAAEVRRIAALYPQGQTLTGSTADSTHLTNALSSCRLIHVAGHGVPGYHRLGGGILLADGPYTGHDLLLAPRLPETLIVSACGPTGSTPLGLPVVAARHGAATVIASTLPVDETVLPDAMWVTHRALRAGTPPAQAVALNLAHLGFITITSGRTS